LLGVTCITGVGVGDGEGVGEGVGEGNGGIDVGVGVLPESSVRVTGIVTSPPFE